MTNRHQRLWYLVPAGGYAVLWLWVTGIFLVKMDLNALWFLAIVTAPTSVLVSWLSHSIDVGGEARTVIEFAGFLVVGAVQYGLIGYLLGVCWRALVKLWKTPGIRRESEQSVGVDRETL